MINVNRHTDFSLIFTFTNEAGSIVPIPDNVKIDFYTNGYQTYTVSKMGDVMTNCAIVDGQFIAFLDNHNLPCGQLKAKVINVITNEFFPDGKEATQKPIALDYTLIEGAGDTPTQASVIKLPSYQKGDRGFSAAEVLVNAGVIPSINDFSAYLTKDGKEAAQQAQTLINQGNELITSIEAKDVVREQIFNAQVSEMQVATSGLQTLKDATVKATSDANVATQESKQATNNAIVATNNANEVIKRAEGVVADTESVNATITTNEAKRVTEEGIRANNETQRKANETQRQSTFTSSVNNCNAATTNANNATTAATTATTNATKATNDMNTLYNKVNAEMPSLKFITFEII